MSLARAEIFSANFSARSFSLMCFSWTFAVGFGPLWLVGDSSYAQAIAHMYQPKGRTVDVLVSDPASGIKIRERTQTKDLYYVRTEIADPFPNPPPSTFTWSHCAMLYNLVDPYLCEVLAMHWASKEKCYLSDGDTGPRRVLAERNQVFSLVL